jgi:hypothetical protein
MALVSARHKLSQKQRWREDFTSRSAIQQGSMEEFHVVGIADSCKTLGFALASLILHGEPSAVPRPPPLFNSLIADEKPPMNGGLSSVVEMEGVEPSCKFGYGEPSTSVV